MAFNISTFKTRGLQFGGARPTLFEVFLTPPTGIGFDSGSLDKFRFTCQAAQLPASTVASVDVGYFGRKIKVAGDRTFTDWQVTVMNDEDFLVRSMFEKWQNALNRLEANVRDPAVSFDSPENAYKAALNVTQYSKGGDGIRQYTFVGAFPTNIDAITLNWDQQNQIETFGVTFAYDYWLPTLETNNPYFDQARSDNVSGL
jgi:hypothetical protein